MRNVDFLSKQVDDFNYYYLDLTADPDGPLAVVCGGWERCAPDYVMSRETFRYYSVEFVADGYGELYRQGGRWPLMPGSVFSYGPGVAHRIVCDPGRPMLKYFVDFTGKAAGQLLAEAGLDEGSILASEPHRIRAMLNELQQTAVAGTARSSGIALLLLRACILIAGEMRTSWQGPKGVAAASFERCRQLVDEKFLALKSLAEIAEACRMDGATICRLFKRFGSGSPYQYLLRRKMNHAAVRLQTTAVLVGELAEEMGFSDAFHFSRAFKRVHGLSPQAFRERTVRAAGDAAQHAG